ncbi:MAG: dihydrodipicolinate synthase family protein [Pseudomonadota bacterium]
MNNIPPRGLMAELVTPLDREGRADAPVLAGLFQRLKKYCQGFLVGGFRVGEGLWLSPDERLGLLAAAMEYCRDGPVVFFEIACRAAEETEDLLNRAEKLIHGEAFAKATVFFHLTPLVYHGNRDLPTHFKALCRLSRRPFVLGNNPGLVGTLRSRLRHRNIQAAVLEKMAGEDHLVGLAADGDLSLSLAYQRALGERPGFRFYDGCETAFLDRPSSSGLISSGVQVLPRPWSSIVEASLGPFNHNTLQADFLGEIWESGRRVRGLGASVRPNPPALVKAALARLGVIPNPAVKPGRPPASSADLARLHAFLDEVGPDRP